MLLRILEVFVDFDFIGAYALESSFLFVLFYFYGKSFNLLVLLFSTPIFRFDSELTCYKLTFG